VYKKHTFTAIIYITCTKFEQTEKGKRPPPMIRNRNDTALRPSKRESDRLKEIINGTKDSTQDLLVGFFLVDEAFAGGLAAAFAAGAFLVGAFFAAALAGPSDPEPRNDAWWMDKHNSFVANTINSGGRIPIIFYGDSITEGWGGPGSEVFNLKYAPLGVANYGIGGDGTQHILWRLVNGEIDGLTPKLVVLKIGTNNISGASTDEIVAAIKKIVETLRMYLPNTKILLLGVLPRNDAQWFSLVADINIKISKLHDGQFVHFLNMFDQFSTAWGVPDATLFSGDLLHLERPGYEKWAVTMDKLFQELLA